MKNTHNNEKFMYEQEIMLLKSASFMFRIHLVPHCPILRKQVNRYYGTHKIRI